MPYFSIITPTYNRAHLIGRTIASVLTQTFGDFELIIVDDGSTDNTKEIIEAFDDKRIRYLYQTNSERGKARNTGAENAKGAYIFFLDSDDLIYEDHLQHAFDELERHASPAFFHSRYEAVYDKGTKQVETLNPAQIKQKITVQNRFACQFFLRLDVAHSFPFSENRNLKIGEDWEVILKIAHRHPLHISNRVTAAIVHHGERSMEIAQPEVVLKSRDILVENLNKDSLIPARVKGNVYSELTTLAALSAAILNQKKRAFTLWIKGIKKRPSLIFKRRSLAILKKIILHGKA